MDARGKYYSVIVKKKIGHSVKMPPFDATTYGLRRKIIGQFYMENWSKGKAYTYKHFRAMKIPKATTYRIMRQCDEGTLTSRKPGSGRPARKMPPAMCKRLQADMKEKVGASQSRAAKKFGITQQYVSSILKGKSKLRYRKRQPAPDVTETQKVRQKTTCTKLRKGSMKPKGKTVIIMDDETYFSLKDNSSVANKGFYTSDRKNAPTEVWFIKKQKFPKKVLFWMAISSEGMSDPVFVEKSAMNGELYEKKCVPLVYKFIKTHHRGKKNILARSRYSALQNIRYEEVGGAENTDSCTCAQSASGASDPTNRALLESAQASCIQRRLGGANSAHPPAPSPSKTQAARSHCGPKSDERTQDKGAARGWWRPRDAYQALEMRRDKQGYQMRCCGGCYNKPLQKYTLLEKVSFFTCTPLWAEGYNPSTIYSQ